MAKPDPIRIEREQAWIGDAVLGLYAREWILEREGKMDAEMFVRLTSNHFLAGLGNPTSIEAEIGRAYEAGGQAAAYAHMEEKILPHFLVQEKKRKRQSGGRHPSTPR